MGNVSAAGQITALDNSNLIALVFIVLVVAAVPSIIVIWNVKCAYKSYDKRQDVLGHILKPVSAGTEVSPLLNDKKTSEMLIREYTSMKPIGLEGTARSAMTVSIIVILGVALTYLLFNPTKSDPSIVKDVLLILSGAVSSIVGFYFGGRAGGHEEMPPSKEVEEAPVPKPP